MYATPRRATSYGGMPAISFPRSRIDPRFGGESPMIERRVVVFPTPFLPSRATTSPSPTERETSWRMWLVP